ncbi:MAG: uracil-DNA glycosylase [Gammaproteobacteria bacterium]|nr:uracil-DNA glycosylase [Gammaproteobacteria bacterium]
MTDFDIECTACPRLADFLADNRQQYPDYHGLPVAPFGDENPDVLIVGLAPGMHGANATGRPFTGDYAGVLLYETLYKTGFSNQPTSDHVEDGLELMNCRITNAVKCLPPQNKPTGAEINQCNAFLKFELESLESKRLLVALGSIAHNAILKALGQKLSAYKFGHAVEHQLPGGFTLIDSYHCSRYNTQTKRLTTEMFEQVFERARELVG